MFLVTKLDQESLDGLQSMKNKCTGLPLSLNCGQKSTNRVYHGASFVDKKSTLHFWNTIWKLLDTCTWKDFAEVKKFRCGWNVSAEVGEFKWTWKVDTEVGNFKIKSIKWSLQTNMDFSNSIDFGIFNGSFQVNWKISNFNSHFSTSFVLPNFGLNFPTLLFPTSLFPTVLSTYLLFKKKIPVDLLSTNDEPWRSQMSKPYVAVWINNWLFNVLTFCI